MKKRRIMNRITQFVKKAILTLSLIIPTLSFAAAPTNFQEVVDLVLAYLRQLSLLFIALSLLVFLFGGVKFIARIGGNEKEIENGKNLMIYGVIGLVVMFSIFGILSIILGEFNIQFGIPQLPEA